MAWASACKAIERRGKVTATTTTTSLTVRCEIDDNLYPKGVSVSDAEMAAINIQRHDFHGDWNYTIAPNSS